MCTKIPSETTLPNNCEQQLLNATELMIQDKLYIGKYYFQTKQIRLSGTECLCDQDNCNSPYPTTERAEVTTSMEPTTMTTGGSTATDHQTTEHQITEKSTREVYFERKLVNSMGVKLLTSPCIVFICILIIA